jgi:hypothetical protein
MNQGMRAEERNVGLEKKYMKGKMDSIESCGD